MHGAAHKMDKPPAHKISLRFSRRGEKSSQNGEKMPMTNAERNQNLQKQTAMGEKSVSSQHGVNPSMASGQKILKFEDTKKYRNLSDFTNNA